MQLHQLKPITKKREKRIGRGGKRGTYSGRGLKGQRARAGAKIRPAQRDLLMRLPKLRGVKNRPLKIKPTALNFKDLAKAVSGGIISKETLVKVGLIKRRSDLVKILAGGEAMAFEIRGIAVSKSAKEKIEKAGGHVL